MLTSFASSLYADWLVSSGGIRHTFDKRKTLFYSGKPSHCKKDATFIRVCVDLAYEIKSLWSSDIHMYSMFVFHCITRMQTKPTQRN